MYAYKYVLIFASSSSRIYSSLFTQMQRKKLNYIYTRIYKYAHQYSSFYLLVIVKLLLLLYSLNMNISSLIFLLFAWKEVRNTLICTLFFAQIQIDMENKCLYSYLYIFNSVFSIGCHYNHVNEYISTWSCLLRSAPASMSIRTQSA